MSTVNAAPVAVKTADGLVPCSCTFSLSYNEAQGEAFTLLCRAEQFVQAMNAAHDECEGCDHCRIGADHPVYALLYGLNVWIEQFSCLRSLRPDRTVIVHDYLTESLNEAQPTPQPQADDADQPTPTLVAVRTSGNPFYR